MRFGVTTRAERCGRAVAVAAAIALMPVVGAAQPQQAGPNKEGAYSGVKPGEANVKRARRPKNRVTWIGFQPRAGGGSRVFVQLTSELPVTQRIEQKGGADAVPTLIVHLEGAVFANRNARRPLDMRFFDTALTQVIARRVSRIRPRGDRPGRKAGIELRISFKSAADAREAQIQLQTEKDGYPYLYLDFGAPGGGAGAGIRTGSDLDAELDQASEPPAETPPDAE